jgi:type II secretory pathway pseudopilin PulG
MRFRPPHFRAAQSAFTMVEIAISLAVIGVALVAIIGVLPLGMNVQRDNREGTIINQDATVFMDAISKGARGLNDLTNYVYAITNYWTNVTAHISGTNGYNFSSSSTLPALTPNDSFLPINSGTNIIGLLSTPQFTDVNGVPANDLFSGGFSNHIIAYVRSMSGAAVEKPPQDNQIIRGGLNDSGDAFAYRVLCVNAAVANYTPPFWVSGQTYHAGDSVSFTLNGQTTYWQATAATSPADVPASSSLWAQNVYWQKLAANLHELRLTFLWPTLPNGGVGNGRQTYRTTVAGQIVITNNLYFFQSQSFTNAP